MKITTKHLMMIKPNTRKYLHLLLILVLMICLQTGCEGPAGSMGPQGPEGPVGPAGENGSVMHAGQGTPAEDLGNNGDYYLDMSSGELYGPKTGSGWGTPTVLKGANGKEGSQIFAGTAPPDSSLGSVGDYYLNTATYDLYGPKTEADGWSTPINLQGNANVQSFDLVVKKADWSSANFHYGGGNNYRFYKIPVDSTGGTTVQDFYNAGNAVLAYARLLNEGTYQTEFLNVKQLPLLTTVSIGSARVGVRIQLSPTRSEFLLNRTTNGFDSMSILDEQVPPIVEFRIVFIEATINFAAKNTDPESIVLKLKSVGVDVTNYDEVAKYYRLETGNRVDVTVE